MNGKDCHIHKACSGKYHPRIEKSGDFSVDLLWSRSGSVSPGMKWLANHFVPLVDVHTVHSHDPFLSESFERQSDIQHEPVMTSTPVGSFRSNVGEVMASSSSSPVASGSGSDPQVVESVEATSVVPPVESFPSESVVGPPLSP